jgi:hypothetical protein
LATSLASRVRNDCARQLGNKLSATLVSREAERRAAVYIAEYVLVGIIAAAGAYVLGRALRSEAPTVSRAALRSARTRGSLRPAGIP